MLKKTIIIALIFAVCVSGIVGCSHKNLSSQTDLDEILSDATLLMCTEQDGTILYVIDEKESENVEFTIPEDSIVYLATNDWNRMFGAWDMAKDAWILGPKEDDFSFYHVNNKLLYIGFDRQYYTSEFELASDEAVASIYDNTYMYMDATGQMGVEDVVQVESITISEARDIFFEKVYGEMSYEEIEKCLIERNAYALQSIYTPIVSNYWETELGVTDVSSHIEPLFYTDVIHYELDDFNTLSPEVLKIAKNEIYARHGYIFANQDLQNYFMGCAWYEPKYTAEEFDMSVFNECETHNLNLLLSLE